MKYAENIHDLVQLNIDYMGLIFYDKSARYVDKHIEIEIPTHIETVGVFVNTDTKTILDHVDSYQLSMVQLHGSESPIFCEEINKRVPTIKAFSIGDESDFDKTMYYQDSCHFFLFDTKTSQYGGSGKKFDWSVLNAYKGEKPFFLSGGIDESDVEAIKNIKHPAFWGIDLNSKFEIEAGNKNINKLDKFINSIRS